MHFSGHEEKVMYTERKKPVAHTAQNSRRNRQRKTNWFNPPYSMNVQTNIGREFLSRHIYLDTQRQQHQFYNELEYFSYHPGLQQQGKRCHLGLTEKVYLIGAKKPSL